MVKQNTQNRDLEVSYTKRQFVEKLRRLANAIETGQRFTIQIAGVRINVPDNAVFNIEHERQGQDEEIEFQIKWQNE
jgi:amphi-Trp domain-containing protein